MSARIPDEKHWLKGTRPTRAAADDSDSGNNFVAGRPKMPSDLSKVAQEEWKRIVRELRKRGTLTKVDSSALEVYVRFYAQWRALCAEVDERGPMVNDEFLDKNGELHTRRVYNPAAKLAIQLGTSLRLYQKEFSVTPASREKAKPAAQPEPPKRKTEPGEDLDPIFP